MGSSPRSHSASRHYDANYANFESDLYEEIRREAYGDDIGSSSWIDAPELDRFLTWLSLSPGKTLLDIACGAGGISLRIAEKTGCAIVGVDLHRDAISAAGSVAEKRGLANQARFQVADCSVQLPFPDASFDAAICIDAINHLPDRPRVIADWARILKPAGKLLFTNATTITGPLSGEELAIRGSIGFFLFVPLGYDEKILAESGFRLLRREDVTGNTATLAARRGAARAKRADALRKIEGDASFESQQRFFEVASRIAAERRLSRFVYFSEKL